MFILISFLLEEREIQGEREREIQGGKALVFSGNGNAGLKLADSCK